MESNATSLSTKRPLPENEIEGDSDEELGEKNCNEKHKINWKVLDASGKKVWNEEYMLVLMKLVSHHGESTGEKKSKKEREKAVTESEHDADNDPKIVENLTGWQAIYRDFFINMPNIPKTENYRPLYNQFRKWKKEMKAFHGWDSNKTGNLSIMGDEVSESVSLLKRYLEKKVSQYNNTILYVNFIHIFVF
jgi:hypothetical protein